MGKGKVLSRSEPRLCEYRVLSSYFLRSKTTLEFVWDGIERALNAYYKGLPLPNSDEVQDAINNSNTELARKLIDEYNLLKKINPKVKNPKQYFDELAKIANVVPWEPNEEVNLEADHLINVDNLHNIDFDVDVAVDKHIIVNDGLPMDRELF